MLMIYMKRMFKTCTNQLNCSLLDYHLVVLAHRTRHITHQTRYTKLNSFQTQASSAYPEKESNT